MPPSAATSQYPPRGRVGCHPHHGCRQCVPAHGAGEARLPEVEHATVRRLEPVALTVGKCFHPDDGLDEAEGAGAPEEGSVETEDAAVGRHQPVPAGDRVGGHPHDRPVERYATHAPVERGITEAEDAAVGRHQPVPRPSGVEAIPTMGATRWSAPVLP